MWLLDNLRTEKNNLAIAILNHSYLFMFAVLLVSNLIAAAMAEPECKGQPNDFPRMLEIICKCFNVTYDFSSSVLKSGEHPQGCKVVINATTTDYCGVMCDEGQDWAQEHGMEYLRYTPEQGITFAAQGFAP